MNLLPTAICLKVSGYTTGRCLANNPNPPILLNTSTVEGSGVILNTPGIDSRKRISARPGPSDSPILADDDEGETRELPIYTSQMSDNELDVK